MSILIAVAKSDYVALCTDCQHTHMGTGLPRELNLPKIESFSEKLYIAHGGSAYITNIFGETVEVAFREAVKAVSEKSCFVSAESLFCSVSNNPQNC